MTKGRRLGLALLVAAFGAVGCGEGEDDHDHSHSAVEDGGGDHPEMKTPCPASIPEFIATPTGGLEVTGNGNRITAKLIDADSNPPNKGDNEWDVLFRDLDGEPLDDLEIEETQTFMPVHGHPGQKTPQATKLAQAGVVRFETVNLFMGGPWEARFRVASEAAGGSDYLVFHVCVPDE